MELVGQSAATVARKVELPPHRLPPSLEAALQTFFNQATERGALLLCDTPGLIDQLVGKLNGGFHTGHPYLYYGITVLLILVRGKSGIHGPDSPGIDRPVVVAVGALR